MPIAEKRGAPSTKGIKNKRSFPNGKNILGLKAENVPRIINQLKAGLSYRTLVRFQKASQLPMKTIGEVVRIPPRTLARRKAEGKLTGAESERLFRLATVYEKTVSLFDGDAEAARNWLFTPIQVLGNQPPLSAVETELGAREVEDLVGRLEHGVFS